MIPRRVALAVTVALAVVVGVGTAGVLVTALAWSHQRDVWMAEECVELMSPEWCARVIADAVLDAEDVSHG